LDDSYPPQPFDDLKGMSMVEETMPNKHLTVLEIQERYPQAWGVLSRQQRAFVIEYISTGLGQGKYDAVAACGIAYPKVRAVKVWASRLLANRRIKKVIALHLGLSDAEMLRDDIKALIKRSHRRGANLDILVAPWLRIAVALEELIAKENSNG
jgi:hypothetical protein